MAVRNSWARRKNTLKEALLATVRVLLPKGLSYEDRRGGGMVDNSVKTLGFSVSDRHYEFHGYSGLRF